MPAFRSNEEFFHAVEDLTAKLEARRHVDAAAELRGGLGCLNGLTDGWALFLEAIERVQTIHANRLTGEERKALAAIQAAVHGAVYRR